ncbi:MAG: hypothetical protein AAF430_15545 [Myxococcota bacterium]
MGMGGHQALRGWATLGLSVALLSTGGCVTPLPPADYAYFGVPASDDAWSRKIRGWQNRERSDVASSPRRGDNRRVDPAEAGELRDKYTAFRNERRRALARDLAAWVQSQAQDHYVPDGAVDHWATMAETFRSNGDDCDGLELLTFHFLRELGFDEDEVYRGIVVRPEDGQHHMVTLWFENPDDPWVIDPTGAMTSGMPRMSEVPGWVPLKVFSVDRDYTVQTVPDLHTAQR